MDGIEILPSGPADKEVIGEFIDDHGRRKGVRIRTYDYHVEYDGRTVTGIGAWAMRPDVRIGVAHGRHTVQGRPPRGPVLHRHGGDD